MRQGRTAWVNFKRVVWHESFYKLLESIEIYSKIGCWVDCGDGVRRRIFPLILILAADYEEQCVATEFYLGIPGLTVTRCTMALIRGFNSLAPCPRCLIAGAEMWDPLKRAPLQTSDTMQQIIRAANQQELIGEAEAILKPAGLRDVEVMSFL